MNVKSYFRHARSLGAFRAIDAIRLARKAAALDAVAAAKKVALKGPSFVSYECLPDGSGVLRFSRQINVF